MPAVTNTLRSGDQATFQRIGRRLIAIGILVWGVWLIAKLSGGDPQLRYFLPVHLLGVIPGAILSRWSSVKQWRNRRS